MQNILVAGGTGLVGSNLITKLKQKNLNIILLTTQKNKANNKDVFYWQPHENIFPDALTMDVDICINLCGAAIFEKRFTTSRKKELLDSRVEPAKLLLQHLKKSGSRLKHYITASATGYYPNICSDILTEDSTKGAGFISDMVEAWERTAFSFQDIGVKVTAVRTGIVLSEKGGFLKQLSTPVRLFAGAVPGNGEQKISWIHNDDLSELIIHIMQHGLDGIYNATAGEPETIGTLTRQIAKVIHRPLFLPNIPVFMLRLIFGERYMLLLTSQNVSSEKIKNTGFVFKYNHSLQAIENLLGQ